MANAPLRVLVVEDNPDDCDLLLRELERGGYEVAHRRVETGAAMRDALAGGTWDLVISDFALPTFSAMAALAVLGDSGLDLPFIIVSGTISEDIAVEALKAGAHDFLLKDRMPRLLPAIDRELRDAKRRVALRAAEDERRRVEAQLLVADRMVAVGTLAAGVAHEINNPLTALMANLELASTDAIELARVAGPDGSAAATAMREELDDARAAAARVRDIVRDLKLFSRGDVEKRGPVDVEDVMESTLRMARNEIRHRATLVTSFGKVSAVDGSESRLGQVFLNLIVNAAQAIPEGEAPRNQIRVATREEAGRVIVEISDTGTGIPPDVMKRLFTPFVSTKPAGIGTGLGLSICHRLVTQLGGEITAETSPTGTTFRVSLKVAATEPAAALPPPPRLTPGVKGKILVIDDEKMIAKAVARTLSTHLVTAESHARVALDQILAGARFDVILCDLMMPEMAGMDFHAELLRHVPEQADAIIFLTGGAFTERARDFLDKIPNLRIDKPFDGAKLREVIAGRLRGDP